MRTLPFFLMAGLMTLVFSCKEKETTQPSTSDSGQELQSFFSKNKEASQTFNVNVTNSSTTITASEGTTITIPKNAFLLPNGQPAEGNVTIEVKELFDKSDMILSGITTVSNGKVLESGGEIFINATADGQQLIIDPDTSLIVGVPKDKTQDSMQLFVGQGAGDNFDWQPVQQEVIKEAPRDTAIGGNGGQGPINPNRFFLYEDFFCTCYNATQYFTSIESLGWINIDCFYGASSTVRNIKVETNGFNESNSSLFVVLKNKKSVINIYADIAFHSGYYGVSLPGGEEITAVVIGNKDGKFFLGVKDFTVTDGLVLDPEMVEKSEADITAEIKTRFE